MSDDPGEGTPINLVFATSWWAQNNATVIFTVIAGALAIAGGIIGAAMSGRSGHRSWLKDRRLDAYSTALAEVYETWALAAAFYADPEDMIPVWTAGNRAAAALARVELLGPDDVSIAAAEMSSAVEAMVSAVMNEERRMALMAEHGSRVGDCVESKAWDESEQRFLAVTKAVVR